MPSDVSTTVLKSVDVVSESAYRMWPHFIKQSYEANVPFEGFDKLKADWGSAHITVWIEMKDLYMVLNSGKPGIYILAGV